jgi:hypothetical protein
VTHGTREVREKVSQYSELSGHDLEMTIADKPLPVVCGPGEAPYAIDHHHVAAPLWQTGVKKMPFILVADVVAFVGGFLADS